MRALALVTGFAIVLSASSAFAAPAYYADRAAFEARFPAFAIENFEDFGLPAGGGEICGASLGAAATPCGAAGLMTPGLTLEASPGNVVVLGANYTPYENASAVAVPQTPRTRIDYVLSPAARVFAGTPVSIQPGSPDARNLTVEIYDEASTLIDTATVAANNLGTLFFGVTSDVPMARVRIVFTANTTWTAGFDEIAFGTPTATAAAPVTGYPRGGDVVTLTTAHYGAGATITFDGVPATDVTVVNATSISCKSPPHAVGAVDVAITSAGITTTLPGAFTYAYAASTVALAATPNTDVTADDTVKLTATITGKGTIGGEVSFKEGATVLQKVSVVSGVATTKALSFAAGKHTIVAEYSGDGANEEGASAPVVLVVGEPEVPGPPDSGTPSSVVDAGRKDAATASADASVTDVPAATDDGGCGCRTTGSGAGGVGGAGAGLALVVAATLVARRRRR